MAIKLDAPLGKTAYVNARLLDPASELDGLGGVLIEGENIRAVGPDIKGAALPSDVQVIDCGGDCLAPGLVDLRTKLGEPGEEEKETLFTAGSAAVAGGVTSLLCQPDTEPVIDDMSVVEFVARRARKHGLAKVYPYGAITKGLGGKELAELGLLAEAGAIAFSDGGRAVENAQVMRQALAYASTYNLLLCQHPEEPSLAKNGVMNQGEGATRLGLVGIPSIAEVIMVERDLRLLEATGGRLHFAHISTSVSIEAIRHAKARGLNVTCDTAPPYFALNEHAIGDYRTFAKLSPPLRGEADREAVVAGLKDGTIDLVASDHTPQDEESKRLPFAQAAAGGIGLETLLPVTLDLYHNRHMSLLKALALITNKPADLVGLDAGRLSVGSPADLVVFDPHRSWKVDADKLRSKAKNSPFDGRPVQGLVKRTVIDGRTVFNRDVELAKAS